MQGSEVKARCLAAAVVGFLFILAPAMVSGAPWIWDPMPPMGGNDPQWGQVRVLWQDHANGKNLPEIITRLTVIRDANPDKVDATVCLAKAYCLRAWYGKNRRADFEKAEAYAAQACKMDPRNQYAIRTLCEALAMNRDRAYIFSHYGDYLKSVAPLTAANAEVLPDMKYAEWDVFISLWRARINQEKAKAAVELAEKMALAHPGDCMAQIWAARTNYFVGEVYTSRRELAAAAPYYKRGISYGEKAMKMQPQNQPANFWYVMNLSRSIQFASLLHKARFLRDLLHPTLLSLKENSGYQYGNIFNILGTMITNGGWVTERGMAIAGITTDNVVNGLELYEMIYPDFLYTPYCRADILAYKGRKKEALAILERLVVRSPDMNPQIPENRSFLREARVSCEALKQGKR